MVSRIIILMVSMSAMVYMHAMDDDDSIAGPLGALERGQSSTSDAEQEAVAQVADSIATRQEIEDPFLKAHLQLLVREKCQKKPQFFMQLQGEITRTRVRNRATPATDEICRVLRGIETQLAEKNALEREQMAGDDVNEAIQRRQWQLDYCRECAIGVGGIVVGALFTVLPTYFGTQAACPECSTCPS